MSSANAQRNDAELTSIFAALGDQTRLQLVARLGHGGARSIAQLAEGLDISHQGVTKHLTVLERAGIVTSARHGREKRFRCAPAAIDDARNYLDQVAAQWSDALRRLQHFVEDDSE